MHYNYNSPKATIFPVWYKHTYKTSMKKEIFAKHFSSHLLKNSNFYSYEGIIIIIIITVVVYECKLLIALSINLFFHLFNPTTSSSQIQPYLHIKFIKKKINDTPWLNIFNLCIEAHVVFPYFLTKDITYFVGYYCIHYQKVFT